jgi:hypothetical protein
VINEGTSLPTSRPKKKTSSKKSNSKKPTAGTYTVPRGHVSLAVPPFWTLRQTNDDIEVEGPSGSTSVIVTAFQRNKGARTLDAREYLDHFLETAPKNGHLRRAAGTRQRATVKYKDPDGDLWNVAFVANKNTLLLATCNTSLPATHKEAKTGTSVLESLRLK